MEVKTQFAPEKLQVLSPIILFSSCIVAVYFINTHLHCKFTLQVDSDFIIGFKDVGLVEVVLWSCCGEIKTTLM